MPKILRSERSQAPIFRALHLQISLGSVTDFPPIIPPHPWWMREGRSYESIRSARDCFVHVQIHISIYRDEECPPQKRRALGYFVAEVGTPSWVYSRRCFHFINEAGSHLRIESKLTCRPPDTSPQRRICSLKEKIALPQTSTWAVAARNTLEKEKSPDL